MKKIINLIAILMICLTSFIFCRELEVEFISDSPWIYGNYWLGGTSFWNNSIAIGSGFSGQSTLDFTESVNIDIRFSTHADSQSVVPVYGSIPYTAASPGITGEFLGWGTFPGTAWDISDLDSQRRLNLCIFEVNGGNLVWNPESAAHGNYEYLIIMLSDYDEGVIYEGSEAYNMDVQYFCWLKKKAGQTWFGTEPAVLQFRNFWDIEFNADPGDNHINLEWQHENQDAEIVEIEHYEIYRGLNNEPDVLIAEIDVGVNSYLDSDVINLTTYYYKVIGKNNAGETLVFSDVIMSIPFLIAYNTEFISNWNGSNENPYSDWGLTNYNDIWGYIDENGKEYALLGAWNGTHIIDISSDPSNPYEVGFIPGSFSTHRDIKTYSNYMYVGTEANIPDPDSDDDFITPQGIQVVDLSDPQNAFLISEWDGVVQSHNIMEADGYLFVIGSFADQDGNDGSVEAWGLNDLIILDLISNPESPELIGQWNGDYLHDVCIYEDILYGCGIATNKMYAFDISDKTSPQKIHEWSGVPSAHACWVSEDGNTLFTASETTNGHIISWDVTDVANENVNQLDEWLPQGGENWSSHNLFVKGNYLYISYYVYGLQILDISDPTNMVNVGHYDTYSESNVSGIFEGAWGTYPFFNSQKVIISDRSTGLYVVNYDDPDCIYDECGECNGNGWDNCDDDDNGITNKEQYGYGAYGLTVIDIPDDQGGYVYLSFTKSFYDTDVLTTDVPEDWEDAGIEGYLIERLDNNVWTSVVTTFAYGTKSYQVEARTLSDSTSTSNAIMEYRVVAAMMEGNFVSNETVTGYSVDNIAPETPVSFSGSFNAELNRVVLTWDASIANDISHYNIYKNAELYDSVTDIDFTDDITEDPEYSISAVDIHENESGLTESVQVSPDLHVLDNIIPDDYSIHNIYPNPFNPSTTISFSIPEFGFTTIIAYDITGKKMETLTNEVLNVGYHTISWNASFYPTGVYFIRMDSGGFTQTQKVVLLK